MSAHPAALIRAEFDRIKSALDSLLEAQRRATQAQDELRSMFREFMQAQLASHAKQAPVTRQAPLARQAPQVQPSPPKKVCTLVVCRDALPDARLTPQGFKGLLARLLKR